MPHEQNPQPPTKNGESQNLIESSGRAAEQEIEVDAVELKTIEIRLNGIKDSAQRSRFVFIILTIVASAILITLWNSILSWNVGHAFEEREKVDSRVVYNQDELINEWVKNRTISVGLLGIRIGVSDLAIIGSASLIVIMAWYFFSQRRENRAIVTLLRDCTEGFRDNKLNKEICSMVYQGIVHSLVFIDVGKGDDPFWGLEHKDDEGKSTLLIRKVLRLLVYLPPFTILMIISSDIGSLFMRSAFRESTEALGSILFYKASNTVKIKVVLFEVVAISAASYTWYLCYLSRQFSKATAKTLRDFEAVIENPEKFLRNPAGFLKELRKERKLESIFSD